MIHVVSSCTDIVKCATFMDADAKVSREDVEFLCPAKVHKSFSILNGVS